jgi:hypothetical protein
MAFWYTLWSFGIFLPFWHVWTEKNLATLATRHARLAHLEVPEEEGEDESDADAHDPRDQHAHQQAEVGQSLETGDRF